MKNLTKLMILAGAFAPAIAAAQLTLTPSVIADGQLFQDRNRAMYHSAWPTTLDNIPHQNLTFTWDPTSGTRTTTGAWQINQPYSPLPMSSDLEQLFFVPVTNFDTFIFTTSFQIGFFGNESIDQNVMNFFASLVSDPGSTDSLIAPTDWNLLYQGQYGSNQPRSYNVTWTPDDEPIQGYFSHTDLSFGLVGDQGEVNKFWIYQ